MSSIDKLSIRGIRSFSPHTQNVIEFYSPLTIIVGHNGAGKTTIIECLKYATTGDLPPNSKGGAFVNDPKLSRETEVKAQIKLKFKNIKGNTMVVTRSLQSTQRRAKLEQKTLEGLLTTTDPRTGEQISISSKCAELDTEIPMHLGVSQAVLENVIFCHQEESFWPLSEPSVLKKKFDDIFAATRYTKALDVIKSIRKELTGELKMEHQKLDFVKSDLEKANRLRSTRETTNERIKDAQSQIGSIDLQVDSCNMSIARYNDDLAAVGTLCTELERLEHEHSMALQSRTDLLSGTREMPESDDQLNEILKTYSTSARSREGEVSDLERQRDQIAADATMHSNNLATINGQRAVMVSELATLDKKLTERLGLMRAASELVSVAFDVMVEPADPKLNDILKHIMQAFSTRKRDLSKSIEAQGISEQELVTQIQKLTTRVHSLDESRRIRRRLIDDNRAQLVKVMDRLGEMSSSSETIADFEQKLLSEELSLNDARERFSLSNYDQRLGGCQEKKLETEQRISSINIKIAKIGQNAEIKAKFDLRRSERERKDELVGRIWNEIKGEFSAPVEMTHSEREADALLRRKTQSHADCLQRLTLCRQDLLAANWKHETLSKGIEDARAEIAQKRLSVSRHCPDNESLEDLIIDTQQLITEKELLSMDAKPVLSMLRSQLASIGQEHACPLCERSFIGHAEESRILLKVQRAIEAQGTRETETVKQELEHLRETLTSLLPLRSTKQEIHRLEQSIEHQSTDLEGLSDEIHVISGTKDDLESELSLLSLEERKALSTKRKADDLVKLVKETNSIVSELGFLEQKLSLSGVSEGLDTLNQELGELCSALRLMQAEVDTIAREQACKLSEIQFSEKHIMSIKEELMSIQMRQAECIQLEKQRTDMEANNSKISVEISALTGEYEEASRLLGEGRGKLDLLQKENTERSREMQARISNMERIFISLEALQTDLTRITTSANEAMLAQLEQQINALQRVITDSHQGIQALTDRINGASKQASEVQVLERTILDNLKIRELAKRAEEINNRAQALRGRLGSFDRGSTNQLLRKQQGKLSDLMGERAGLMGEIKQLQDQLARLVRELDTDYANIEGTFRGQYIKVKSTGMAIEDLDKYAKALDQAIMRYHSLKMDEVNKIIREIWTNTYQGADIDTIEIRADHDAAAGARSYNYRVVMIKGDTELDMRGRSSAGQRVLTSLIIRLALAETFGAHCGILALDEPTTNLDHANIESLANSLAQIVTNRRLQANFQLVIITHDEEFVQLLGHHNCADYYWRVRKDEQQYSCIERQSIRSNVA